MKRRDEGSQEKTPFGKNRRENEGRMICTEFRTGHPPNSEIK
jgi:hypothetical protein